MLWDLRLRIGQGWWGSLISSWSGQLIGVLWDSAPGVDSGPSVFTAVQEQLGLKLQAQKSPVEVLVIDNAEKPSGN